MAKRGKLKRGAGKSGLYFSNPSPNVEFVHSGSTLLNCIIGGGWPLGRISNVVGDKSTGKTLLGIEAVSNFAHQFPDNGGIWFNEAEAAFDEDYAAALGMPIDKVTFVSDCYTVEDLCDHLEEIFQKLNTDAPAFYILDSLDALSDQAELDRDVREGSYGAAKAKKLSELFRRQIKNIESKKLHVMIISQVRDRIGVSFGRKTARSGGKALDFYASQVVYLSHIKTLKRTRKGVERPIGINIKAKCDKCKIGLPFRECEFPILFGYGIDDLKANLEWLKTVKKLDEIGLDDKDIVKICTDAWDLPDEEYKELLSDIASLVQDAWKEIEIGFLPTKRKY
ncbi:hypothetical protein LCGC14_0231750 [marine sediment metagenome]|uniref:RecA family profile 2 domain-containing protein n=1 Tax=marine sediment metagenome TaxID=412755 RepID=A0A0F9URD2_9ZZZZ